jgi:hypothetical protein
MAVFGTMLSRVLLELEVVDTRAACNQATSMVKGSLWPMEQGSARAIWRLSI